MLWLLLHPTVWAQAPDPPPAEPVEFAHERVGWGWGALPAINYNSDEGLGLGAVGSVYRYDGETGPYKTAINGVIFATTLGVHSHSLEVDTLNVADTPLRLTVRGDLKASSTSNYCGVEVRDPCGESQLAGLDLTEQQAKEYLWTRFVNPIVRIDARYAIAPMPHRVEIVAGLRTNTIIPGTFTTDGPYEPSLYAETYGEGETGTVATLQAGIMVDNRDNEPAPTSGYWVEATLRGMPPGLHKDYGYIGVNTTVRTYLPLGTRRLVFANRAMFDTMAGDVHHLELATPGGTQRVQFFGQLNSGRGVRLRRYLSRFKVMDQAELRWNIANPRVFGVKLGLTALGFTDLGIARWHDGEESGYHVVPTEGAGVRFAFDDNFILRVDAAFSAVEDNSMFLYIDLKNLF